MAIEKSDNFQIYAPKNIDVRLGPYNTANQATASIGPYYRYQGMTVLITGSGETIEYWFKDGIADSNLVLKTPYVNTSSFLTTGSTSTTQSISGSIIIYENLTVYGTASFYSASFQNINVNNTLLNQNTITVFSNTASFIDTGGYKVADTGSLSKSSSLLYNTVTEYWTLDKPLSGSSFTGSFYGTASWAYSASNALNSVSASYASSSTSASYASSSTSASYASSSTSASYASSSTSASYASSSTSASYASSSTSASYASSSTSASYASSSTSASYASASTSASYASSSTSASYASASTSASYAETASYVVGGAKLSGGTDKYIPLWNSSTTLTSSFFKQDGTTLETIYGQYSSSGLQLDFGNKIYCLGNYTSSNSESYFRIGENALVNLKKNKKFEITYGEENVLGLQIDFQNNIYALGYFQTNPANTFIKVDNSANKLITLQGNTNLSGSLTVTGDITGSLLGTASYVSGAVFDSNNPALSASYASGSTSASYASSSTSASYASSSTSASYASSSTSASYASSSTSASYASSSTSASYASSSTSASYASSSTSASYASSSTSASYASSSTSASYASSSTSASYASSSTSASYASSSTSASYASSSTSASYASSSTSASYASSSTSASYAQTASYALNSTSTPSNLIYSGSVTASVNVGTGSIFTLVSASSTFLTVNSDGNTGFNTISPSSKVHIKGTDNVLLVDGSGSANPIIFNVQGAQGALLVISDTLSGSLFSVNNSIGLPVTEIFSDGTINMGSPNAPSLYTTANKTLNSGTGQVIYNIPTASYDSAYFDYNIRSGSHARAGQIIAIWSGSEVNFTDIATADFGNTSAVTLTVLITGSNMALTGSVPTNNWSFKTIVRAI